MNTSSPTVFVSSVLLLFFVFSFVLSPLSNVASLWIFRSFFGFFYADLKLENIVYTLPKIVICISNIFLNNCTWKRK